jgi:hypothetical protein
MKPAVDRTHWKVGQHVARKTGNDLGVVVDVDSAGTVKVKWDSGKTSYYHPRVPGNVRLAEFRIEPQPITLGCEPY